MKKMLILSIFMLSAAFANTNKIHRQSCIALSKQK